MGQAGPKLRKTKNGYNHWCPACGETHHYRVNVQDRPKWEFDGNLEKPTFKPSMKITGVQTVIDSEGRWTGDFKYSPSGQPLDYCCHYFITNGEIRYCNDCTHSLKGCNVPLPDLPPFLQDKDYD